MPPKTLPKTPLKTHNVNDFWNALGVMYSNFQKIKEILRLFLLCFFLTKESLILSALKQKILDEFRQSNCIKLPQKSTFKNFFVTFFLTKKIYVENSLHKQFLPFT